MATDTGKLVEQLGKMTVLELVELKNKLEEEWGVTAAAPVAVAGPVTMIVGLFKAPLRDLVGVIDARIRQLEEQGEGEPAAEPVAEAQAEEPAAEAEAEPAAEEQAEEPAAEAEPEPAPEAPAEELAAAAEPEPEQPEEAAKSEETQEGEEQ